LKKIEQFILDAGSDSLGYFGGTFEGGIQCQQVADEFAPCIKAILDSGFPIETYLEIGSAAGGSVFIINHFFNPKTIVIVDDNAHWKAHIRPYILRDVPHTEIVGNAHDIETASRVFDLGVLFDALLIDGDHIYEGVKADVETYSEFLKPGGFLIFHDSQIGAPFGCAKVFKELKTDKRWTFVDEYVSKKHSNPCGVGLFRKAVDEKDK